MTAALSLALAVTATGLRACSEALDATADTLGWASRRIR